jgi:hypothetical protein
LVSEGNDPETRGRGTFMLPGSILEEWCTVGKQLTSLETTAPPDLLFFMPGSEKIKPEDQLEDQKRSNQKIKNFCLKPAEFQLLLTLLRNISFQLVGQLSFEYIFRRNIYDKTYNIINNIIYLIKLNNKRSIQVKKSNLCKNRAKVSNTSSRENKINALSRKNQAFEIFERSIQGNFDPEASRGKSFAEGNPRGSRQADSRSNLSPGIPLQEKPKGKRSTLGKFSYRASKKTFSKWASSYSH